MGYMGFGMRREDYTRKPKKGFEKIKQVYGKGTENTEHDPDQPKLTREEVLNKQRNLRFTDSRGYKIIKFLLFVFYIALVAGIVWSVL